jgi:hypothetical protein
MFAYHDERGFKLSYINAPSRVENYHRNYSARIIKNFRP